MALKVSVEGLPEGTSYNLILSAEPKTTEEFEAIVEALGGAAEFRPSYGDPTYIVHESATGQRLMLYPPEDYEVPETPKGHPFIREFGERIEAAKDREGGGSNAE